MSETIRETVKTELTDAPTARLTGVLSGLGIASSTWYQPAVAPDARRRPGPAPRPVAEEVEGRVLAMAQANPWYGYKRIAVTVIDYYSRYLLAARLTWSYCATEVIAALQEARAEAERLHGPLGKPPFLVTDNGSSFLAKRFNAHVKDLYTHVRIRYRTPTQLGLLERFHQTLKNEEIYWQLYDNPAHARDSIAAFRRRYNESRPHWALIPEAGGDPVTPQDVYESELTIQIPKWQGWARGAKQRLEQLMGQAVPPEAMAS